MSTSKRFSPKKQSRSVPETPTYPSPQSSRSFAPLPTSAPEQAEPNAQTQLQPAAHLEHSLDRFSIFPPEHYVSILSQDGQQSDHAAQQKRPVLESVQTSMESTPAESALAEKGSRLRWNIAHTPIFPDPAAPPSVNVGAPVSPGQRQPTHIREPRLDQPPILPPSTSPIVQRQDGDETPEQHITPQKNGIGLPDALKAGVESLSGMSLDDVKVHYNSPKPAALQALAYTQGSEIHVAPGQEKHLPHEAWHVVQQRQGLVQPTLQAKGVPVNDDEELEEEADVMGKKAVQKQSVFNPGEYAMPRTVAQRKSLNHETKHSSPRNMLFGMQQSADPVQMIHVGWVPSNPGKWRKTTNKVGFTKATRGGGVFNIKAVAANNAANAATGKVKVTIAAGHLLSDVGGNDIPDYIQAATLTPEIDHIVEAQEGGANDFANARVITKAENNAPATPRPDTPAYGGKMANVDFKIYTPVTITATNAANKAKYGGPHKLAAGAILTFPQARALTRYATGVDPVAWNQIDGVVTKNITKAAKGTKLNIKLS